MNKTSISFSARLRPLVAVAALAAAGVAQAVVTPPSGLGFADYGNGGNIFELTPSLFVNLVGIGDPVAVVGLNADLSFTESFSGFGTGLVSLDYRVHNAGSTAFGPMRFMLFANADGDTATFMDAMSETWGLGDSGGGNPVLREVREFTDDPFSTVTARFRGTGQLVEGSSALDAACTVGCDAVIGLQWDAPTLGPGATFRVVVGLSDSEQSLSKRWIDATAVNSPGTMLRVSGMSQIIPVPEPASAWMLVAGLAVLGGVAARHRARY